MSTSSENKMRLYSSQNERLYLNASEMARFLTAASAAPPPIRLFAMTLAYTGVRISEARQLRSHAVQLDARVLSVRCLKKRKDHVVREIPIPHELVAEFALMPLPTNDCLLWHDHGREVCRIRAYRWIKALMRDAGLDGPKACPKGLRHAYGARAAVAGIPLHMLQRWMGHSSMQTTAIYATVLGPEQLMLADRMWQDKQAFLSLPIRQS